MSQPHAPQAPLSPGRLRLVILAMALGEIGRAHV